MAKKSVYFGDPINRLLESVGSGNVSGSLNGAVARYLAIVEDFRPNLTKSEWCAICDVLNGVTILGDRWGRGGRLIAMELEDYNGLADKWGIDLPSLVATVESLTTPESIAVLHVVETFWTHADLDTDEAFLIAGLKF